MKIAIPILALSALALSTASSWSGDQSGKLGVKMDIMKDCLVNLSGGGNAVLEFGNHPSVGSGDIEAVGIITVKCSAGGLEYMVAFNNGEHADNPEAASPYERRRMRSDGGNFIRYQLYQDAVHRNVWTQNSPSVLKARGFSGVGKSVNANGDPVFFDPAILLNKYIRNNDLTINNQSSVKSKQPESDLQSYTVYGLIQKSDLASALPGTYSDTVRVTVEF